MQSPRSTSAAVLLALLSACSDGSGLGEIAVTVEGTVAGPGSAPVESVWVHLLAGREGSPRAVAADETDAAGMYAISTEVDPADCNDLRLRVLETQAFDASADPLGESLLGSCGNLAVDFVVDVEAPTRGTIAVSIPARDPPRS